MSGSTRSVRSRGALMLAAALVALSTFVAAPVFLHGRAAVPFGSTAFAQQWNSAEAALPNFWGPAEQPAQQEAYRDAPTGSRLVQYFDKARMEQPAPDAPVTNGLLTVELISGRRQFGDATFGAFPPSSLPIVGDPDNAWPPYSALASRVFAENVARSGDPAGTVYKGDGTFGRDAGLAAEPAAAPGGYVTDPGGRYAHNIPLAFWNYLAALPVTWQTAMGFPLTEAVWVNVRVAAKPTWVLMQPFERRVLSFTPTNPPGFQVEMGNIGLHYFQWRYVTAPGEMASAASTPNSSLTPAGSTTPTASGTPGASKTPRATASGTPTELAITNVQLGVVTESTFSLTFKTTRAATTEILYGTASHAYEFRQDVSTTAAQDHAVTLTNLAPRTKYYFALRATTGDASSQRKEDYFTTVAAGAAPIIPATATATRAATASAATSISTASATDSSTVVRATATDPPTATTRPTPTDRPTATARPTATDPPTATPHPTATTPPAPKTIRVVLSQVTVTAFNPVQIAPETLALEHTTLNLTLTYQGASGSASATVPAGNWTREMTRGTATTTDLASTLVMLTDKQTAVTFTVTVTIPFTDTTTRPLVISFTQPISLADYSVGKTYTSPPQSNASAPSYSVITALSVALD